MDVSLLIDSLPRFQGVVLLDVVGRQGDTRHGQAQVGLARHRDLVSSCAAGLR